MNSTSWQSYPPKTGITCLRHVNAPHGPYVFDSQGNFRYINAPENNLPYYTDAVTYVNQRVLELVDPLISQSSVPPSSSSRRPRRSRHHHGTDKNAILEAYYFPGRSDIPLYDTLTPVNTFRMVLK